jgi:hypothetical protein
MIKREGSIDIEKKHEANFERWFHKDLYNYGVMQRMSQTNYIILHGHQVRSYRGCIVNGVRYQMKECE